MVFGDITGTGIVDIVDILLIQQYILNVIGFDDVSGIAADVNRSGLIDIVDILLIQQYILNRIGTL